MVSTTQHERLVKAAKAIRHEFPLLRQHMWKLPLILGSLTWFLKDRYRFEREKSELDPAFFLKDHIIIALKTLYTLPLLFIAPPCILTGLWLYDMHIRAPGIFPSFFCLPFKLCLDFLTYFLSTPEFEMREDVSGEMKSVDHQDEEWYIVNGIVESPAMIIETARILHSWTGRPVTPLVNPSHGIGIDIMECIMGRTLDTNEAVVKGTAYKFKERILYGKKVVCICHSQGGIVVSNVVRELVRSVKAGDLKPEQLAQLEVYTFGSAADDFPGYKDESTGNVYPFVEHFAAQNDIVGSIGALTASGTLPAPVTSTGEYTNANWNGNVYMLTHSLCQGHLMKEHLLPALRVGLFGQDSNLMKKYCSSGITRNRW